MEIRVLKPGVVKLLALLALGVLLPQCHSQLRESSTTSSRSRFAQEKFLKAVTRSDIQNLFKKSSDFVSEGVFESLSLGRTSCKSIISKGSVIAAGILPWPTELKDYLTDLLEELPSDEKNPGEGLKSRVVNAVDSVFLVSKEILTSDDGGMAAGLACDLGEDNMGVLFLNEFTFVTDRLEQGLKSRQSYAVIPSPHLVIKSADNAAVTFLHEVFHALDNKYFKDSANVNEYELRSEIRALSWRSGGEPRYRTVTGLDLSGGVEKIPGSAEGGYSGCRPMSGVPLNLRGGLGLVDEPPPEDVADRLQQLESKTNFIVPYTQANPSEDFAESLAVYYFGRFNNVGGRRFGQYGWQRREVYTDDLRRVQPRGSKLLQSYDTQTIFSKYPLQRTKMCKLAALVFKENEETCLETLANGK